MPTTSEPDDLYYVYGLIDPQVARLTKDDLKAVFYVGKGKGRRWHQHAQMVKNELIVSERMGSKQATIRRILERGEPVPALIFASGIETENDAYNAEQLTMSLVEALLKRTTTASLTNATPGHNQTVIRLPEVGISSATLEEDESFLVEPQTTFAVRNVNIEPERRNITTHPLKAPALFVKGTREPLALYENRVLDEEALPWSLRSAATRITTLKSVGVEGLRRGWDPDDPWDGSEASIRARRYWSIADDRVLRWIQGAPDRPQELWLGIPTANKETVVRYVWRIDYDAKWEYYPEAGQWGVPIGEQLLSHDLLNRVPVEVKEGKSDETKVLLGYAAGWRHLT